MKCLLYYAFILVPLDCGIRSNYTLINVIPFLYFTTISIYCQLYLTQTKGNALYIAFYVVAGLEYCYACLFEAHGLTKWGGWMLY